jgi:hypothetical protein
VIRRALKMMLLCGVLAGIATPQSAGAWDPSTTHQAILEQALLRSALHVRWMNASELQRGLFSPLRVDPNRLSDDERPLIARAQHYAHADSGARGLGGPGACPGADAPPETQLRCVDGDVWELTGLGWLRLGIVAETTPTARHVHHFLDRKDPESMSWEDEELSRALLRVRQSRSNGAPVAGVATLTNFSGDGPSALAWLEDENDPLAPARLYAHLESASTAASAEEREHHLAMALVCTGALLHVAQNLSVPAHARGDVTAFFAPLSPVFGDRGLPLQEYARQRWGGGVLPGLAPNAPAPGGAPVATSLRGHLLGEGNWEGVARLAARRFLSESSLPAPRAFAEDTSAEDAAAIVLEGSGLDPVETKGARLTPWPAPAGYLVTGTGRPLLAFDTDESGLTRFFIDETVYRDQSGVLLPAAVEVTRSLLDLLYPELPSLKAVASGSVIELEVPADLVDPKLTVMLQDGRGLRRVHQELSLRAGESNRIVGLPTPQDDGARVVLVLAAQRIGGVPFVAEHQVAPVDESVPVEPEPESEPEPEQVEPEQVEPEQAEPEEAEPEEAEPEQPATEEPAAEAPNAIATEPE